MRGSPTAPSRIASVPLIRSNPRPAESRRRAGSVPHRIKVFVSKRCHAVNAFSARLGDGVTSLPMPSPGMTAIRYLGCAHVRDNSRFTAAEHGTVVGHQSNDGITCISAKFMGFDMIVHKHAIGWRRCPDTDTTDAWPRHPAEAHAQIIPIVMPIVAGHHAFSCTVSATDGTCRTSRHVPLRFHLLNGIHASRLQASHHLSGSTTSARIVH